MSRLDLKLPSALEERFSPEEILGEGAQGLVFRAQDLELGRSVIVKLFLGDHFDETGRERFLVEAKVLADLHHPRTVPILDFGEVEDCLFFVQPFHPGETLKDRIQRMGPLPLGLVQDFLFQCLEGLSYVHSKGLIHRDLKPGNLLLLEDDEVKLIDFGLAREQSGDRYLTRTGTFVGTALYVAPDQIQLEAPDPRDDLYSLGWVAYVMLAGDHPYRNEPPGRVFLLQIQEDPPPIEGFRPDLPKSWRHWLSTMMARSRGHRFAHAEAAAAALQTLPPASSQARSFQGAGEPVLLQSQALPAFDPSPPASTPRAGSRALLAALLIGGIASGGYLAQGSGPRAAPPIAPGPGPSSSSPGSKGSPPGFSSEDLEAFKERFEEAKALFRLGRTGVSNQSRGPDGEPLLPFLDPDPRQIESIYDSFPFLREFFRKFRQDELPPLTEASRAQLASLDHRFESEGLLPPFEPLLYVPPELRPESAGMDPDDLPPEDPALRPELRFGLLESLTGARREVVRLRRQFDRNPELIGVPQILDVNMGKAFHHAARESTKSQTNRRVMRKFFDPGISWTRKFLALMAQAIVLSPTPKPWISYAKHAHRAVLSPFLWAVPDPPFDASRPVRRRPELYYQIYREWIRQTKKEFLSKQRLEVLPTLAKVDEFLADARELGPEERDTLRMAIDLSRRLPLAELRGLRYIRKGLREARWPKPEDARGFVNESLDWIGVGGRVDHLSAKDRETMRRLFRASGLTEPRGDGRTLEDLLGPEEGP